MIGFDGITAKLRRLAVIGPLSLSFLLGSGASSSALAEAEAGIKPVTDMREISPREDLRLKLFQAAPGKPACTAVQTDPHGGSGKVDPDLDAFLHQLLQAIKTKDDKALQPLFHKRLNIGLAAIAETFAKLDFVYGPPFDVSVYRLWGLNTVDGSPTGLACDDDRLTIFPQFGYPLHFAVWMQIMGQKELGRIYVDLVPADGKWNIGAFHAQQWTHDSKDFATWAQDAMKAGRMGFKEAAYVKYDIAAKLLDGAGFLNIAMRDDILKAKDALITTGDWEKSLKTTLKDYDVVYASTLLIVGGGGILVRIREAGEISVDAIKEKCKKVATTLAATPWGAYVEGVRCSFLLPKDDAKADGPMGGIMIPFADVRKQPEN